MKKYLLATIMSLAFINTTFAAICSCDALPSCGTPPASCFNIETSMLVGKTFEEQAQAHPKKLSILKAVSIGILGVNYGGPLDGRPFGQYYIRVTTDHSFNLGLNRPNGSSVIVDKFSFVESEGEIQSLENSEGTLYLLVQ